MIIYSIELSFLAFGIVLGAALRPVPCAPRPGTSDHDAKIPTP